MNTYPGSLSTIVREGTTVAYVEPPPQQPYDDDDSSGELREYNGLFEGPEKTLGACAWTMHSTLKQQLKITILVIPPVSSPQIGPYYYRGHVPEDRPAWDPGVLPSRRRIVPERRVR